MLLGSHFFNRGVQHTQERFVVLIRERELVGQIIVKAVTILFQQLVFLNIKILRGREVLRAIGF